MSLWLIRLLTWMVRRYGKPFKITGSYYRPSGTCEFHATDAGITHCDGAVFLVESVEWFPRGEELVDIHCWGVPLMQNKNNHSS